MLESVVEVIGALQAETASYPANVRVWMKVLAVSFLISLLFVYKKPAARWILAAFVVNVLGLIVGKLLFPEASRSTIGTLLHLVFWTPILWAAWRSSSRPTFGWQANDVMDRTYLLWFCWVGLIMLISLVFDLRALIFR